MRTPSALLAAFVVAAITMIAGPASAHHVTVTGQAVCNTKTGDFDITWTLANSETDKVMSYTSRLGSGIVPPAGTATQSESVTDEGEYTLYVLASWPNGVTDDAKGRVWATGDCDTPPPPPPPPPTTKDKHVRVKVAVRDECSCWRDSVRIIADHDKVRVRWTHPRKTVWVFKVTGRKVTLHNGDVVRFKLPNEMRGHSGWAVSQRYVVKTTNKVCPCKRNHTCEPHPNVPIHTPCRPVAGGVC